MLFPSNILKKNAAFSVAGQFAGMQTLHKHYISHTEKKDHQSIKVYGLGPYSEPVPGWVPAAKNLTSSGYVQICWFPKIGIPPNHAF